MKQGHYFLTLLMLAAAQVLICNYLHLSQFIYLSILPAIILLIPIRFSTPVALCIAFICGMLTDLLGDGVLGLNTFALLPVALLRPSLIRLVCGEEIFARKEDISIARQGYIKISICLIVAQAIFLLLYIWADGAGTRPLWFNALRFFASLLAGFLLSLLVTEILAPEKQNKW